MILPSRGDAARGAGRLEAIENRTLPAVSFGNVNVDANSNSGAAHSSTGLWYAYNVRYLQ